MGNPHLPQEIMTTIFLKLPTKSVAKCRCLSKTWLSVLSTPEFARSHLRNRRPPREENLLLITSSNALHTITPIADADAPPAELELTATADWTVVSGSCDGLVLLLDVGDSIFLVNPTTAEHVAVRSSPEALEKDESFSMYGFGYDASHDDYKIVALSFYDTDNEHHPDVIDTFVDVYSLKSGAWRRLESSPYDHAVPELAPGAHVGGSINWLASSREPGYRSVIAAFDLAREVFDEIPAPSSVDQSKFVFDRLVNLGGCLCMAEARGTGPMDVWIMKEYGDGESWTKFSVETDYEWDFIKPLCYVGGDEDDDDEVVFITEAENIVAYNRRGKTLRSGVQGMFVDGGAYVESLLSPRLGPCLKVNE